MLASTEGDPGQNYNINIQRHCGKHLPSTGVCKVKHLIVNWPFVCNNHVISKQSWLFKINTIPHIHRGDHLYWVCLFFSSAKNFICMYQRLNVTSGWKNIICVLDICYRAALFIHGSVTIKMSSWPPDPLTSDPKQADDWQHNIC